MVTTSLVRGGRSALRLLADYASVNCVRFSEVWRAALPIALYEKAVSHLAQNTAGRGVLDLECHRGSVVLGLVVPADPSSKGASILASPTEGPVGDRAVLDEGRRSPRSRRW